MSANSFPISPVKASFDTNDSDFSAFFARAEVEQAFSRAGTLIDAAQGAIQAIAQEPTTELPDTPTFNLTTTVPSGPDLTYNPVPFPSLTPPTPPADFVSNPITLNVPDIADIPVPVAPSITIPTEPSVSIPSPPDKPTVDTTFTDPGAPSVAIPSAPTLAPVDIPDDPVINIPTPPSTVEVSVPEFTLPDIEKMNLEDVKVVEPSLPHARGFDASDIDASSIVLEMGMKDSFKQILLDMSTPRTVQDTTDQEVARQEDLIDRRARREIDTVWEEFAARGHTAPPGTLGRRVDAIRANADAEITAASRDVAMERMRNEVQVFTSKLQEGVRLAQAEIEASIEQYRISISMLSESSRATTDAYNAIVGLFRARIEEAGLKATLLQTNAAILNAKVQEVNARIDAERLRLTSNEVNARIYDTQVRGALAPLEVFTAKVEAARAKVQANLGEVQVFEAQIRGEAERINLYQSQLQAERARLDGALAQVQVFQTEVSAFREEVNAVSAQFDNYSTRVNAAIAPIQLFESEMRGFASRIEGERLKTDVAVAEANANVNIENSRAQAFTARMQGFGEEVRAFAAELDGEYRAVEAKLRLADTQIRGNVSAFEAQTAARQASWQAEIDGFRAEVEAFSNRGNLLLQQENTRQATIQGAARISASLAAAALSSVNVGEQVSTTHSRSASHATQNSYSGSESNQFSGSNIFQGDV